MQNRQSRQFCESAAKQRRKTLTAEQSQRLLDATRGTRAYLFCLLALQTGMRRGELCGLMWSDVDFPAGVIHVRHNALLTNAQTTVSDTLKTSAAVRDIPIPPTLFAELVKERKGAKKPICAAHEKWQTAVQKQFQVNAADD